MALPVTSNSEDLESSSAKDVEDSGELVMVVSRERDADLAEGTFHQMQAEADPTRTWKQFFSPLPRIAADAVNKDAETVEFTPDEEVRSIRATDKSCIHTINLLQSKVRRKIDIRVLSLVIAR